MAGAVGNYNAHMVAYPNIDWQKVAEVGRQLRIPAVVLPVHSSSRCRVVLLILGNQNHSVASTATSPAHVQHNS
jgi:hypothetical protein